MRHIWNKLLSALLVALIPLAVFAQDTAVAVSPVVAGDWRKAMFGAAGALLPYIQARVVVVLMDWIKRTYAWVDAQAGITKELMVVLLNAVPVFLSSYLGIPGLVGLDQWDYTIAGTVLSSAVSFGVKAGAKSKALENKLSRLLPKE